MEETTIKYLREAGWYEGRKVDITDMVKLLEEDGYVVFDAAKHFLEEFGDLEIEIGEEFRGRIRMREHSTVIDEDFIDMGGSIPLKEEYVPVAIVYEGEMSVWISESGKFYLDRGWVGDSAEEMWDHVISYKGKLVLWEDL